eukprot:TRINITY_DN24109_c0_g1_i1.p1 TRINITY_DN24109_c0_g1~~TRINITY_DN24109_c0_g1_i1.p1  ORF type:complete len:526 (-),score=87.55 TRINITY_DN24109_c0_g1_i1:19-1596(-)
MAWPGLGFAAGLCFVFASAITQDEKSAVNEGGSDCTLLSSELTQASDRGGNFLREEDNDIQFLQTGLSHQIASASQQHAEVSLATKRGPFSQEFFDSFDRGETTLREATSHPSDRVDTTAPFEYTVPMRGSSRDAFETSASAGAVQAWQTYPEGSWQFVDQSTFVQRLSTSHLGFDGVSIPTYPREKPAEWFDDSVLNFNQRGQPQQPMPNSPQRLLDVLPGQEWNQRAVNTTVRCKEVACTAKSLLQVFDPQQEEAKFCRLNVEVHPTDYDNEWSHEFIKVWKLNGRVASSHCNLEARGCNASASRPLIPCVQDLEVDHLLAPGSLVIEGSINKMVDECPYEGYLLSAVATVTCMTRKKLAEPLKGQNMTNSGHDDDARRTGTHAKATLQCDKPGCESWTHIQLLPEFLHNLTCLMNITVQQTDFDETAGVPEEIEFITLGDGHSSSNISTNVKPGRNPCTEEYTTGKPAKNRTFAVVTNKDITKEVLAQPSGYLHIGGKISSQVDECASNDMLFDGLVEVACT